MRNYEVTYIVDPVLSDGELKNISEMYQGLIKTEGSKIVNVEKMGLKQLAYQINKRTTGIYECVEFQNETGDVINKLELALRRDERIMRFLTVSLDKFGVKYNEDKRNGLIGKKRKDDEAAKEAEEAKKALAKDEARAATAAAKKEEE